MHDAIQHNHMMKISAETLSPLHTCIVWQLCSTHEIEIVFKINIWFLEVGNTAKSPWVIALLKEIWESPNLTFVGFEPMISELDLPMLYQLSYEASMGAGCGSVIDIV